MPGCVRKIANVLGGDDVGGGNVVSEDASCMTFNGYVIVPCHGSSSFSTPCEGLRWPVDMGLGWRCCGESTSTAICMTLL
jgi:hypothetical protein